ncbi:MAG: cyanophycinase [Bacteroidetes bacterium]|nr:cyanophycinase [Bacteroidota bacterium]
MRKQFFTIALLLPAVFQAARAQTTGSPATVAGPEKGTLIIVGGGTVGPEIWQRFVTAAGGSNAAIVIIPTANEDSAIASGRSMERDMLKSLGIQNITMLHTRNAQVANTDSFVAPLKKATGIWFVGGRQWRLADAYLHTKTHAELKKLLDRGGVIAGTSAGATIQGSFLLRGDTKGNTVLIGDHREGMDFLHNVAIDQHVLRRNRQFDLLEVIKKYPELLGIGIDESTAIVVQQDHFEVIGNSYVAIYDSHQFDGKTRNPAGDSGNNGPFYFLGKGQHFDLKERKIIRDSNSTRPAAPAN